MRACHRALLCFHSFRPVLPQSRDSAVLPPNLIYFPEKPPSNVPLLYPTGLPPSALCSVVRLCGVPVSTASSYRALQLLLQRFSLPSISLPPRYLNSPSNLFSLLSTRQFEFGSVLAVIDQATILPPCFHFVLVIPVFFLSFSHACTLLPL